MIFNVGDIVTIPKYLGPSSRTLGVMLTEGTVVGYTSGYIHIDFGPDANGHLCGGLIDTMTGWNVHSEAVKLKFYEAKYTPSQIGDRDDDV